MLKIRNNGADDFSARFAGIMYAFPAGGCNIISKEAAAHIFGFGKADKTTTMAMHGWMTHSSQLDSARDRLNSFSFHAPEDPDHDELPESEAETPPDDQIEDAEIVPAPETEQESALLLTESGAEPVSDGAEEAPPPAIEEAAEIPPEFTPEITGTIRLKPRTGD